MINTFKMSARAKKSAVEAIKGYMVGEPPLMAKWSYDAANTDSAFYDELEAAADELTGMGLTPETLDDWIEQQEKQTAYEVIQGYMNGKEPKDVPPEQDTEPWLKYSGIKKVATAAGKNPGFNVNTFNLSQVDRFLAIAQKHQF